MAKKDSESNLLSTITRGASLHIFGKAVINILGFLLQFVLTRGLGPGLYGVYAYGNTFLKIALVFTNLGSGKSLLRYLPKYKDNPAKRQFVFGLAVLTSFFGAVLTAGSLFVFAPTISAWTLDQPEFVSVLRLFAILLISDTAARIIYSVFRSLEQLEYEVLTNKITRPVFRLATVVIALSLGFSLLGIMIALIVASLLTVCVAAYFLLTKFDLRPSFSFEQNSRGDVVEYYNYTIPLVFQNIGHILIQRVDILFVGYFFTSEMVGIYNISVLISGLLILPLSGFNQLFPPIASRLYAEGKVGEINSLYKIVTRWIFTLTFIIALGAIVYRNELLQLFGPAFTDGSLVLVFFVIAQLFNSLGGANGYLLMMTDHQYVLMTNQWIFGILNVIFNYIFILEFGLIGAAIVTASVLALLNLVKTIELWYLERLFPYTFGFLKPLVAGVAAVVPMISISFFANGIFLLIAGGVLGGCTYILVLYLLGIDKTDKEFFREAMSKTA